MYIYIYTPVTCAENQTSSTESSSSMVTVPCQRDRTCGYVMGDLEGVTLSSSPLLASGLACTRYCHSQYCKIHIAIRVGRGETIYYATEWAMRGGGVPKQRDVCKEYY